MKGYEASSYGDGMADVYDEWYERVSDIDATVAAIIALTGHSAHAPVHVLELGVGTGRLAIPLANHGVAVTGIDASEAMLSVMRAKPGGGAVAAVLGDMAGPLPDGQFDAVFVAYNTFFGLLTEADQRSCLREVHRVLAPGGFFAVEVFVPDPPTASSAVEVRTVAVDRVVLSVSRFHTDDQIAEGQFVEFTEQGGVRLRPWAVRYASPEQLDAMASDCGLRLAQRHADWGGEPFDLQSVKHVSIYRRETA